MCPHYVLKTAQNGQVKCRKCQQTWQNYTEFNAKREQNTHILAQMIAKRDQIGGFEK